MYWRRQKEVPSQISVATSEIIEIVVALARSTLRASAALEIVYCTTALHIIYIGTS